ncbi:MAG TPA: lysylphosphatidylglycerol synthase transmembrane domain-containing protein [Acidobacteriota bacterium]|nr:lysylphosphatidylglycerol synthase transmembrane domain-containing protein [Acidobacteriota bacterium]
MNRTTRGGSGMLWVRLGVSLGLLAVLAAYLDLERVATRLRSMDVRWVVLALVISLSQIALSAWRWRFTAGRLGLHLPFVTALREYALGSFLNQLLPGGVAGDLARAWRHGRSLSRGLDGQAVRAVVLERASGQIVMLAVAGLSFAWLPRSFGAGGRAVLLSVALVPAAIMIGLFVWARLRRDSDDSLLRRAWADARAGLFSPRALPAQLISSGAIVASYITVYLVAARAVGVDTPMPTLLPLVAPVLVTMLIPLTIAGWGVRETGAALLWGAAGLPTADGVAISLAYGLLVLVSSLPGAAILIAGPPKPVSSDRDRKPHRCRD